MLHNFRYGITYCIILIKSYDISLLTVVSHTCCVTWKNWRSLKAPAAAEDHTRHTAATVDNLIGHTN